MRQDSPDREPSREKPTVHAATKVADSPLRTSKNPHSRRGVDPRFHLSSVVKEHPGCRGRCLAQRTLIVSLRREK